MKEWQLYNVQKFGIDLPMDRAYWLPAHTIQDLFDVVAAKDVNPQAIQPEGSLGYQWWEWLAEVPTEKTEKEFVKAARYFSWNYPQLKMVIHECRFTETVAEDNLDDVHFMVEFYS